MLKIPDNFLKEELEFEARYYLSESRKLQNKAKDLLVQADKMLELSVNTWQRAREEEAG